MKNVASKSLVYGENPLPFFIFPYLYYSIYTLLYEIPLDSIVDVGVKAGRIIFIYALYCYC